MLPDGRDVQFLAIGRGCTGGGASEQPTARYENRIGRVGDWFHEQFAADAVCLADAPHDHERARGHLLGLHAF